MDARTARERQSEVTIVDVREDLEWKAGHIDGAHHIPLGELLDRFDELPPEAHIVTVCAAGARSQAAAVYLKEKGLQVDNLDGGMLMWSEAGLPVVADDGSPGRVLPV